VFDEEEDKSARMVVDGETIGFSLEEKVRRERYQPTPAEKKRLENDFWCRLPQDKFFPSGDLSLKLHIGYWGYHQRATWSDGKKQRVETCLNKFIGAAYKASAVKKADLIERLHREREREEQARRRKILRQRIEQGQGRLNTLNEQAKAWQEAQQLRAYIQAVEEHRLLCPAQQHYGWSRY
jgi:hypothetical protein